MVSKVTTVALFVFGALLVGCGSSSDDEVVIEGPKASDLKEVGQMSQGGPTAEQAKPAKPSGPPSRDRSGQ